MQKITPVRAEAEIFPYEEITQGNRKNIGQIADELLKHGWSVRGYPRLCLKSRIPWGLKRETERSWNFYIHSLDMIDPLLLAYNQTGETKYLKPAVSIALDWIQLHTDSEGVSPMAWYDMAVGLRAYRLGYLYQAGSREGLLKDPQRSAVWRSLDQHRANLTNDGNIAFHNNHGYYQIAGQLALGRRFRDVSSDMAFLYEQGQERLNKILEKQFTSEGVHLEHSPDYHRMVLGTFWGLIRSGLVDDRLKEFALVIEKALAWFVTPAGTICNFGDSDSRLMITSAPAARRRWSTAIMRSVASNGETGGQRPAGLRVFKESGYAVVRVADPNSITDASRDSYLAQTAAFHSRTHKHADDLSFIWHDRGQPLLVDAGRYGYIGKTRPGSELWHDGHWYSDPMRVFMESTRAHNTLEFDDRNFLRKGAKPYGSALIRAREAQGVYAIESRCKHFGSIWHDRLLIFLPAKWLIVFDVFNDNLKMPHQVKQWFHLAPGHQISREDHGFRCKLANGGEMDAISLLDGACTTDIITAEEDQGVQGWWSPKEKVIEPAPAFAFELRDRPTGTFATLFTLENGSVPDVARSRSNPTGRKARLRWRDPLGVHQVEIDRMDLLSIQYRMSPA